MFNKLRIVISKAYLIQCLFLLFILSGCGDQLQPGFLPGEIEKYAHRPNFKEYFDIRQTTIRADGKINDKIGQWNNSEIRISDGRKVMFNIKGTINLEARNLVYEVSSNSKETITQDINNNNINLKEGSIVQVSIIEPTKSIFNRVSNYGNINNLSIEEFSNKFNNDSIQVCNINEGYVDGCVAENGMGLEIYIDDRKIKYFNKEIFPTRKSMFSQQDIKELEDYIKKHPNRDTKFDAFINDLNIRTFVFESPQDGLLGFNIYDSTDKYTNNIGSYRLNVTYENENANIINGEAKLIGGKKLGAVEFLISKETPEESSKGRMIDRQNYYYIASDKGTLWFRVVDTDYSDNKGEYKIDITLEKEKVGLHSLFKFIHQKITSPLIEQFKNISKIIFTAITQNFAFKVLVKGALQLYIIFYAIAFLFGFIQITQKDLIIRVIKIAIVLALIRTDGNPDGATISSVKFFHDNLFTLFIDGMNYLVILVTQEDFLMQNNNMPGFLGYIDIVVSQFWNLNFWIKVFSFISIPFIGIGIFLFFIIISFIFNYIYIILEAYIGYLIIIILISLLISIGPFIIILILFEKTRSIFKNWILYMANLAIQPMLIFMVLIMFNGIIAELMMIILDFKVVWQPLVTFRFDLRNLLEAAVYTILGPISLIFPLFTLNFYKVENIFPYLPNIGQIFSNLVVFIKVLPPILVLLILINLLKKIPDFIGQFAEMLIVKLGAGTHMVGGGSIAKSIIHEVSQGAKSLVGRSDDMIQKRKNREGKKNSLNIKRTEISEKIIKYKKEINQGGNSNI